MVCVFQQINKYSGLAIRNPGRGCWLACQLGQVMSPLGLGDAYLDNEGVEAMISSAAFQLGHAIIPQYIFKLLG